MYLKRSEMVNSVARQVKKGDKWLGTGNCVISTS